MVGKNCFMKKNYATIGVDTDDDLPLNKPLKFPTLTIIIRCVLQKGEKLWSQYKCQNTTEQMFQKELALIKQTNQKSAKFVITGTLKILVMNMNHFFIMVLMV